MEDHGAFYYIIEAPAEGRLFLEKWITKELVEVGKEIFVSSTKNGSGVFSKMKVLEIKELNIIEHKKELSAEIYNLELHQQLCIDDKYMHIYIRRVPGGWIYRYVDYSEYNEITTSVYVPYSDEFKDK